MADLARVLVQDGVLDAEGAMRAVQASRAGDVASAALELGLADEGALVRSLARLHECPGVDLSRSALPTGYLDAVAPTFCRERRLLPVTLGKTEIVLAMADPDDLASADEIRFVTGKKVLRYAAVGSALARAMDGLERSRAQGGRAWRGERAPTLSDPEALHLAVVKPGAAAGAEAEPTGTMELAGSGEPFRPLAPAAHPPAPAPGEGEGRPAARAYRPDPVQATAARQEATTLRLEGPAVGKVVLVADDDPDVCKLVATVLGKLGCLVLQAGDGKAALEAVRDARPDLVVLDAMMPGMHGFEVCRVVKGDRELRGTRVVLCSAVYRGTVGADARAAYGADGYVEKPFRLEELIRVAKGALVGPAAETAEERARREEAQGLWRAASEALAADRVGEAVELARGATERDPWSAEAHYYLGHALTKQDQLLDAVAAYERAAELRPDVDASYQCLAQCYERLGFLKSAREAWGHAIETCKDEGRKQAMQDRLIKLFGLS